MPQSSRSTLMGFPQRGRFEQIDCLSFKTLRRHKKRVWGAEGWGRGTLQLCSVGHSPWGPHALC